jgi:hypothetical protein
LWRKAKKGNTVQPENLGKPDVNFEHPETLKKKFHFLGKKLNGRQ